MTGKTMMPDNFDEYFEKWLARKITQKEIANELKVSQSVVSNWIIQFRKDTGKDRDYIKTDAFKDALKGYEDKELSTRQAGRMLGITHTGFRKLVMKAQEQQKDSEEQKHCREGRCPQGASGQVRHRPADGGSLQGKRRAHERA